MHPQSRWCEPSTHPPARALARFGLSGEPVGMATTIAPVRVPYGPTSEGSPALRKPTFREGFVPRPRLVKALRDGGGVSLAALVAPPGYGKTTLLSEWAAHDHRPFAWV